MNRIIFFVLLILFTVSCESKKIAEEKKPAETNKTAESLAQIESKGLDLFLNPEIGKEYVFESLMNQKIMQKLDTVSYETKVFQSIVYSLKPVWKDTATLRFQAKFLEIEQKITSPMISVNASTKKQSQQPTPLDLFYSALKGKTFEFIIGRRGENLSLIGFDSLIERVITDLSKRKEFKGVDKNLISQLISNFFNQNELQKSFEKVFEIYPKKKVNVGDNWKVEKHLNEPVPTDITNNFSLKAIQGDSLIIDLVSDVKFEKVKSKEGEPQVKEMSGRQNGSLIVNKSSGMLQSGNLNQSIRIVNQFPPSPQTNNKSVTLLTNINSNFLLKLK